MKKKFIEFIEDGVNEVKKIKKPKDLIKQIPNLLTITRLILVPFIITNIINNNLLKAGIIMIIASVTDLFDGLIARNFNLTTNFGAKLDAFIDKIFIISISSFLFSKNCFLIIPILLDIIIAIIISKAHIKGIEPKTSNLGKIKTFFLDTLIIIIFFKNYFLINYFFIGILIVTIFLQILTSYKYYNLYLKGGK